MKSFVITLKEYRLANDLMARCIESGKKFDWNIEPFWAVDGRHININDLNKLGLKIDPNSKIYNRKGAIGCFLSHYFLWKKCVLLNEPIIVLESDVVIKDFIPVLPLDNYVVKLHINRSTKTSLTTGIWSKGAYAYAIHPKYARQIVSAFDNIAIKPADKAIGDRIVPFIHLDIPIVEHLGIGPSTTAGSWTNA